MSEESRAPINVPPGVHLRRCQACGHEWYAPKPSRAAGAFVKSAMIYENSQNTWSGSKETRRAAETAKYESELAANRASTDRYNQCVNCGSYGVAETVGGASSKGGTSRIVGRVVLAIYTVGISELVIALRNRRRQQSGTVDLPPPPPGVSPQT